MTVKLELSLDGLNIKYDPPDPKAITMLRERGYAEHDVQRIAKALAADIQFAPQDPKLHDALFKHFVRQYIVPSVASALHNEAQREKNAVIQ